MSYAEFSARAHAVAVHLLDQGLPAGTPVASLLPNSLEAIWVSFGIKLAGLCEVPLGWGYTADEIRWCAQVSGAKVLITREARAALAGEAGLHPMISADIALHDRGRSALPRTRTHPWPHPLYLRHNRPPQGCAGLAWPPLDWRAASESVSAFHAAAWLENPFDDAVRSRLGAAQRGVARLRRRDHAARWCRPGTGPTAPRIRQL